MNKIPFPGAIVILQVICKGRRECGISMCLGSMDTDTVHGCDNYKSTGPGDFLENRTWGYNDMIPEHVYK